MQKAKPSEEDKSQDAFAFFQCKLKKLLNASFRKYAIKLFQK